MSDKLEPIDGFAWLEEMENPEVERVDGVAPQPKIEKPEHVKELEKFQQKIDSEILDDDSADAETEAADDTAETPPETVEELPDDLKELDQAIETSKPKSSYDANLESQDIQRVEQVKNNNVRLLDAHSVLRRNQKVEWEGIYNKLINDGVSADHPDAKQAVENLNIINSDLATIPKLLAIETNPFSNFNIAEPGIKNVIETRTNMLRQEMMQGDEFDRQIASTPKIVERFDELFKQNIQAKPNYQLQDLLELTRKQLRQGLQKIQEFRSKTSNDKLLEKKKTGLTQAAKTSTPKTSSGASTENIQAFQRFADKEYAHIDNQKDRLAAAKTRWQKIQNHMKEWRD
jgi:hypothetical protein